MKKAVFLGVNALGDTLCTTPVLRAFKQKAPDTFVIYVVQDAGFCRVLDGNPDADMVLYSEQLYLNGAVPSHSEWLGSLPPDIQEPTMLYHFDIRRVCSAPESFREHIALGFSKLLGIPVESLRPVIVLFPEEIKLAKTFVRKPFVVLSMHSVSNPPRTDGNGLAKDWPVERWLALAEEIRSSWDLDVIAVGSERDPQIKSSSIRNLYGMPIKVVAALLQEAMCVITLENGIAHLCAAVDAPTVEIYSSILPLPWAFPEESTCCEVLYGDPQEISCGKVMDALRFVMSERERREGAEREKCFAA